MMTELIPVDYWATPIRKALSKTFLNCGWKSSFQESSLNSSRFPVCTESGKIEQAIADAKQQIVVVKKDIHQFLVFVPIIRSISELRIIPMHVNN